MEKIRLLFQQVLDGVFFSVQQLSTLYELIEDLCNRDIPHFRIEFSALRTECEREENRLVFRQIEYAFHSLLFREY
jgi:hypothetical protein